MRMETSGSRRTRFMARRSSDQPTDGELEILRVLWDEGPSGLGSIHKALARRRDVALTTVATMLGMMLAKELVERENGPRGYIWRARVSREQAAKGLLGKLLEHVFDGSARRLVAHLLEDGALADSEREELRALLESKKTGRSTRNKQGGR